MRYSIVERSSDEIDRENILACTENGMVMAVERLEVGCDVFPPSFGSWNESVHSSCWVWDACEVTERPMDLPTIYDWMPSMIG